MVTRYSQVSNLARPGCQRAAWVHSRKKASCTASSASTGSDSMRRASASILGRWRFISVWAAARSPRPTRATSSASGSTIIRDQLFPALAPSSTLAARFSVGECRIDQPQEQFALGAGRDLQPVEVVAAHTDVGIELVCAMFVEMQKAAAGAIEAAARLFLQAVALADVLEQRLDPVER